MKIVAEPLPGLLLLEPRVFGDLRGYFLESYQAERYVGLGVPPMVQDNLSRSRQGVVRGLHYQHPHGQGKLVQVIRGAVWDVAVDLRQGSPALGRWFGVRLDDENHWQMYLPPGFAHGFGVLSDVADVQYKCTDYYHPEDEVTVAWNDPELAIAWPIADPILAPRDAQAPRWRDLPAHRLPVFEA